MVKMALGSSDSQASSTSSASASRIDAYQTAIGSLESFMGAGNLQGEAYSSAKSYAGNVLIPLFRGAILLSEGVNTAVNRLPSDYRNEVSDESLDSEVLEQEIATYQAAYNRSSEWLSNEMAKEVLSESSILRAQQSMARNLSKVQELQEKLEKLIAFDGKSPSLFSEVDSLYAAVSQGLSQVKEGFSSFSGSFSLPPKSEMAW
ncbi:T7SS effector LXG polymorphic toxin, partial [Streptococcus sp. H31]|uniref:T7SS effector LXG polymorphic toxin n=1 Tax=Streptococcus huangxiaojuni TaxID=3237239 RepID=UPI0034A59514